VRAWRGARFRHALPVAGPRHAIPRAVAATGVACHPWADNAVDAMDGQGTLRVATRAEGDEVVVEIGDPGPGMAPEVAARGFEAFYTTKDVGRGTGLGLDIARRIVLGRHGGTITIDPQPSGTVLRVRLPNQLHQRDRGTDAAHRHDEQGAGRPSGRA